LAIQSQSKVKLVPVKVHILSTAVAPVAFPPHKLKKRLAGIHLINQHPPKGEQVLNLDLEVV
jgi:hypothetical protein